MDFYSTLKALSMIATGVFGVIGVLTNYKDKDGQVTKWGKIAIVGIILSATLSVVLYNFEAQRAKYAADKTTKENKDTQKKLDISLGRSQEMVSRLQLAQDRLEKLNATDLEITRKQALAFASQVAMSKLINREQLHRSLLLEPLSLYYEREIPMDNPEFSTFVPRLRQQLAKDNKEFGIDIQDRLRNRRASFTLDDPSGTVNWLPDKDAEPEAYKILTEKALVQFVFSKRTGLQGGSIAFMCYREDLKGKIQLTLPAQGTPSMSVSINANFARGVFIQKVFCENPQRAGDDMISMSSVDLVGRFMTWGGLRAGINVPVVDILERPDIPHPSYVAKLALFFPYEYRIWESLETNSYVNGPIRGTIRPTVPSKLNTLSDFFVKTTKGAYIHPYIPLGERAREVTIKAEYLGLSDALKFGTP